MSKLLERASKRKAYNEIESKPNSTLAGDRSVRQDIHAVIKHFTAILLEDRPEFCTSPEITELSASAVESIILSQVYDIVFEEILNETTKGKDEVQQTQPLNITNTTSKSELNLKNDSDDKTSTTLYIIAAGFSERAINALRSIPTHRSVSAKLECCVNILEAIFSSSSDSNTGSSTTTASKEMGADWLLESVCKHIIYANVPNLDAELLFLEEFASDRQLLRGIEGYSLITMLASLNFLNAANDIS